MTDYSCALVSTLRVLNIPSEIRLERTIFSCHWESMADSFGAGYWSMCLLPLQHWDPVKFETVQTQCLLLWYAGVHVYISPVVSWRHSFHVVIHHLWFPWILCLLFWIGLLALREGSDETSHLRLSTPKSTTLFTLLICESLG